MYQWPSNEDMLAQYCLLMQRWSRFLKKRTGPGLVAGQHFNWLWWWKETHTNQVLAPELASAAFMLWHFSGMWGVSEARAESIASMFKHCLPQRSSRLSLDRVSEKVVLRQAGLCADGSSDKFILRVWGEFFGSLAPSAFSFNFKHPEARRRRFPLGGGSSVIHKTLKESRDRRCWPGRASFLRDLPFIGVRMRLRRAHHWHRFLRHRT